MTRIREKSVEPKISGSAEAAAGREIRRNQRGVRRQESGVRGDDLGDNSESEMQTIEPDLLVTEESTSGFADSEFSPASESVSSNS